LGKLKKGRTPVIAGSRGNEPGKCTITVHGCWSADQQRRSPNHHWLIHLL